MAYNENDFKEVRENISCAEAIKSAVRDNSSYIDGGTHFEAKKAVEQVLSEFPAKRVALIIAHQVIPDKDCLCHSDFVDGRYSRTVKEWARETIEREPNFDFGKYEYCDIVGSSHPVIINAFAEKFIKKEAELAAEECAEEQTVEYAEEAAEGQEEMCL